MASLAVIAGTAFINALAFSGTNAAFSLLGDHGKTEMKRHNLAMERYAKARDEYQRKRQQRLDYINKSLKQQRHAEQTFNDLGVAMQQYYEITGKHLPALRAPPKFSDYYNPSEQQKDIEIASIIGAMTLLGVLTYKYI